ncbi:MAG: hypothetical protein ABI361_06815 [Nitrososphaera sp.]|jgi:hypothetical protein
MLREKPTGIDLLAIVMVISGIFCFFSGIDALFFSAYLKHAVPLDTSIQGFSSALSTSAAIWGSVLLALGVGQFLAAYGLFVGSSWAWSASVALCIVGIIIPFMNIITGYWPSIFTLILSAVILYYLSRSDVKAYFGRTISEPSGAAAA